MSIICVYNDAAVLASCLQHSVAAQTEAAPETELLAIDNREGQFSTAGAALNHGARAARNDVVVFVHQDVVLHSLPALEEVAAELLDSPGIGVLGAVGIDGDDRIVGRIRDRIVQIGAPAPTPHDVQTLDEVLLMTTTERIQADPLSEDPLLAWHAYGVEYAVRMRRAGRRAVARDIPLTHNSLSTNLAQLDVAHRHVGDIYPEFLPIHTTCGTIRRDGAVATRFAGGRRRYNSARLWWRESLVARSTHRISPDSDLVLADIRMLIDDALRTGHMQSLRVVDLDPDAPSGNTAHLHRFERPVTISTSGIDGARAAFRSRKPDELLFIAGLTDASLSALAPFDGEPHVLGNSHSTGQWALFGVTADELASLWPSWRNRPVPGLT
ncbi:glycosyltransferase [Microbacterium sp. Root61]|uniref:glycosyltransferase n=1 Tax=Microbacterium sp. Root61 TaxID=1736570 RepID=UPI00138F90E3|nr:glycosyltransferase [Microbacterium sp. Root61]